MTPDLKEALAWADEVLATTEAGRCIKVLARAVRELQSENERLETGKHSWREETSYWLKRAEKAEAELAALKKSPVGEALRGLEEFKKQYHSGAEELLKDRDSLRAKYEGMSNAYAAAAAERDMWREQAADWERRCKEDFRKFTDERDRMREALERISDPQCGCRPVCRCLEPKALEIFRSWAKDTALEALSPAPAASQEGS